MKEFNVKNGKYFSFDREAYDSDLIKVEDLNALYLKVNNVVSNFCNEFRPATTIGVIISGIDYLQKQALKDFEEWAKSTNCPSYLMDAGREKALNSIPDSVSRQLYDLRFEIRGVTSLLQLKPVPELFEITENTVILGRNYKKKLERLYTAELDSEFVEACKSLEALLPKLREINESGISLAPVIASIVGDRYRPKDYPQVALNDILEIALKTRQMTLKAVIEEEKQTGRARIPYSV